MTRFLLHGALILAVGSAATAFAQSNAAQDQSNPPAYDTRQQPADQSYSSVPQRLTLPAGTIISVRTTSGLSSDRNQPGDRFSATLDQPLIASGWVVARRGQTLIGRVAIAQKAGHGNSSS